MGCMPRAFTMSVSERGHMRLPAALRRRWRMVGGGKVTFIDLGRAALVLPCDVETAREEVGRVLLGGGYERGVEALDDPDLVDQ